jgi:hypothetical protein
MSRGQVTAGEAPKTKETRTGRGAAITKKAEEFELETVEGGGFSRSRGLEVAAERGAARAEPGRHEVEILEGFEGLSPSELKLGNVPLDLQDDPDLTGKAREPAISRTGFAPPPEEPIISPGEGGTGKGGIAGSFTGALGPGIPGELTAKLMAHVTNSAMIEKLGYQARFDSLGLVVDVDNELDELWRTDFKATKKQVDDLLIEAEEEHDGIRDLMDASRADQINPGEFFANIGGAGRFGAAMALGAGAMATAFGGGPNAAMQIISQAIDRNVRAQIANQTHNRALIAHQSNFVHTIRALANDRAQYANFLRIGYTAMARNRVATITAGYGQTMAKLAFQNVDNKLGAMLVQAEMKALTAAQQKVTFKFKSLAQLSKQLQFVNASRTPGTGGSTGPSLASGRVRGGGGKQLTGGGQPTTAAEPTGTETQGTSATANNIEEMKTLFKRYSESHTDIEVDALQKRMVAQLKESGDLEMANTLQRLGRTSLLDARKTNTVRLSIAGQPAGAIPGPAFDALKGEAPAKAKTEIQSAGTASAYARDLHSLLSVGSFSTRKMFTQHLRNYKDERLFLPARDPKAAKLLSEITIKTLELQEFNRLAEGTRNALDKVHEMVRAAHRTGSNVDLATLFTNMWIENPKLRQSAFEPVIEIMNDKLVAAENKWDLRLVRE